MRFVVRQALDDKPTLTEVVLLLGLRLGGDVEVDLTVTPGCEAQVFSQPGAAGPENKGATLLVGSPVRGAAVALFGHARLTLHPTPPPGMRLRLMVRTTKSGEVEVLPQDKEPAPWKDPQGDDDD